MSNKNRGKKLGVALAVASVLAAGASNARARRPDGATATLTALSHGAMPKAGYYMPQRLTLSSTKPAGITKEPAYVNTPLYGGIPFGTADDNKIAIALDESPDASSGKLYIDANADGDLTNDPSIDWKRNAQKVKSQAGAEVEMVIFQGAVEVHAKGLPAESAPLTLAIYRFSPETSKARGLAPNMLLYYRDYGREGKIDLGGKSYSIMVLDELATGRYDQVSHTDKEPKHVSLLIDRNGDGKFGKGEQFDLGKPFNIGGTTYELDKITADGASLSLKVSDKKVAEIPLPADLGIGRAAIAFKEALFEGKAVSFPSDYSGKLVMLDFWAMWCGPCRGEIPGLVKTYEKYHSKGFEVLGITLDPDKKDAELKKFLAENKMSWPQVYDGKYWQAAVAQMYTVDSIPRAFLVDGSTGKIVASGNDLRGEALDGTISKALAAIGK